MLTFKTENLTTLSYEKIDTNAEEIQLYNSSKFRPSPNLLACGLSEHNALRTIRYSIGRYTTVEDIVRVVNELVTVVLDKR